MGDTCYATPTNKERNAISAGIVETHIKDTHPVIDCDDLPPNHTIFIEAEIRGPGRQGTVSEVTDTWRNLIIELGDDDVRCNEKTIDPCLKCYRGAYFMCLDNENIAEDGTANGTQGRLKNIKLKHNAKSLKWKD